MIKNHIIINMKNTYLFIIWNEALWCKNKIISDLNNSFEIIKYFYIQWDNNEYEKNLQALYGRKLGPANEKISLCGKGKFLVIIINDNNPKFDNRKMYDGFENVNTNVYDKKFLYRKWTAGSHRIHCSDTEIETLHDLVVLFGYNYNNVINSIHNNEIIKINTKGIQGFDSQNDILNCISLFATNITKIKNNTLFIFTKCKYDLVSFLNCTKINNNLYNIEINNQIINIIIFGELDGDLPNNSFNYLNNNICNSIVSNFNNYINYINGSYSNIDKIIEMFEKNNIEFKLTKKTIVRKKTKYFFIKCFINKISLLKQKYINHQR